MRLFIPAHDDQAPARIERQRVDDGKPPLSAQIDHARQKLEAPRGEGREADKPEHRGERGERAKNKGEVHRSSRDAKGIYVRLMINR